MRVRHFYPGGYFHPPTRGADVVAAGQLDYFLARGWAVDCVVARSEARERFVESFRRKYDGACSVTAVDVPRAGPSLREQLFAYEHAARSPAVARALGGPADLFFTSYVFTSPLLRLLPRSCKRMLAPQTAPAESQPGSGDALASARRAFLLRTELELYRLYDAVLVPSEGELAFLRDRGVSNAIHVAPFYEPPVTAAQPRAGHDHDLICVASDTPANVHGLMWFHRNVYVPYLWRHGIRLLVVGGVCRGLELRDVHITLIPEVQESLADLYASARIALVPIIEGTGVSARALEALALGRALVLTPMAARGIADGAGAYVQLDMRADPRGAADAIRGLLASPRRREELETAARDYARRAFNRERHFAALDRVLAAAA